MIDMAKTYLTPQDLMDSSFSLARQVYDSDFRPDFILAIWRGGTPVGAMLQEFFEYMGAGTDHIAIRTSCYDSENKVGKQVRIYGLDYVLENTGYDDSLLIVDDVFDTGTSVQAILQAIRLKARRNTPHDIRVATPYFKPARNQTTIIPDYYVHANNNWLVFPHELQGLSIENIRDNKPWMSDWADEQLRGKGL